MSRGGVTVRKIVGFEVMLNGAKSLSFVQLFTIKTLFYTPLAGGLMGTNVGRYR